MTQRNRVWKEQHRNSFISSIYIILFISGVNSQKKKQARFFPIQIFFNPATSMLVTEIGDRM